MNNKTYQEMMKMVAEANITIYNELNATNSEAAREEFLAHPEMRQPNFVYGNLDIGKIRQNLIRLDQVREQVEMFGGADGAKHLGTEAMALNLALNDATDRNRLVACLLHLDANSDSECYQALNHKLYGEPDLATFESLLSEKISHIKANSSWFTTEDHELFAKIAHQFPALLSSKSTQPRFRPTDTTVKKFGVMLRIFYENLIGYVPKREGKFSPAETVDILNQIFTEEFCTQYRGELNQGATALAVDEITKIIKVPTQRVKGDYTYDGLIALVIGHELGVHALRSLIYEDCPAEVMSQTMPGSSVFDEGLAKCVEQALGDSYTEAGVDHYLAIGMANFCHSDFREVYEVLLALKMLDGLKQHEAAGERADRYQKQQKYAFNYTRRCFRGLGKLPFNKDLIYFNGTRMVWQFIEQNIDRPEWLFDALFLSGKTNILLPEHQQIIYECQRSYQSESSLSEDLNQPWYTAE